jgi:tetratricopeptide (TPR) repeat protein
MKAERRHDLKTNALARGVEGAPELWREYGSRILLVVLVAAIVFLLVKYWNEKKAQDAKVVAESIEAANNLVHQLNLLPLEYAGSASELAENRQKTVQQAEEAINKVLNSTKDPKTLANAYLARGDLNWSLANFPDTPGAATLPAQLQISDRSGLADQARSSYEKVLVPPYSGSTTDVFYARMGLAAVAENQGQWDQARAQYQAIKDGANMPDSFKEIAGTRLGVLPKVQTPVLLVPPPVVAPGPPASMPTTGRVAAPTTAPSVPTTMVAPPENASPPATGPASHPTTIP